MFFILKNFAVYNGNDEKIKKKKKRKRLKRNHTHKPSQKKLYVTTQKPYNVLGLALIIELPPLYNLQSP